MPFKNIFKKKSGNYVKNMDLSDKEKKSLLAIKVVQAQQNPEDYYDLSNCCISQIPNDTFFYCKLLGKTSLNISQNSILNLESGGLFEDISELKILNASKNKIEKLPSNIDALKKLTILNLSDNKLKSLPESFSLLHNLNELNLSSNKYTEVPNVICALPKLRHLNVHNNSITEIPKDITGLWQTLVTLECDYEKITNIPDEFKVTTVYGIMNFFFREQGKNYCGPVSPEESPDTITTPTSSSSEREKSYEFDNDILMQYTKKKQLQQQAQIFEEKRLNIEKIQLENILNKTSESKKLLMNELDDNTDVVDYDTKKKEKLMNQVELEKILRNNDIEHLDVYFTNSNNKEVLLQNLFIDNKNLSLEVEAIVSAKEKNRQKLVDDLSKAEQETDLALKELINFQQIQKSTDFIKLLAEQEEIMQCFLLSYTENTAELRQTDVLQSMKQSLLEDVLISSKKKQIECEKQSWLSSLINHEKMEDAQIEALLNDRASNQESFLATVLQKEELQAEAFKLLLLKMDLKRNNIVRQIAMVEFELTRISTLEFKKKRFGVKYGSSTMLNQRQNLVSLLKSLFKAKEDRDEELSSWFSELSNCNNEKSTEDFWLMQYQKLMSVKPATILQAEQELDEKVYKILSMANAIDLVPLFAKNMITFQQLLNLSEKNFTDLHIGSATYHSIQRTLNYYMGSHKLEPQVPSAPSAPADVSEDMTAAVQFDDFKPSAPHPEDLFIETECVVCLEAACKILFIPCGHVSVCAKCCSSLESCPLCRSEIKSKCFVDFGVQNSCI